MIKDISMKELEIRELLQCSTNWSYIKDIGVKRTKNSQQNFVLAECRVCGTQKEIPKSKFFRRVCDEPCPGCQSLLFQKAPGLIVDQKYRILYINPTTDLDQPLTCTIECIKCGSLRYNVKLRELIFGYNKLDYCVCPSDRKKKGDKMIEPVKFIGRDY